MSRRDKRLPISAKILSKRRSAEVLSDQEEGSVATKPSVGAFLLRHLSQLKELSFGYAYRPECSEAVNIIYQQQTVGEDEKSDAIVNIISAGLPRVIKWTFDAPFKGKIH